MKLGLRAAAFFLLTSIVATAAGESVVISPIPSQSDSTSTDKTALLRVTVVDSSALQSASFGPGQKEIAQAAIEQAKEFGAIEKSTLATYFAKNNVVAFWRSNLAQKGTDIFNNYLLQNLWLKQPSIANKLRGMYPRLFNGLSFDTSIPENILTTSPLSLTKTVPKSDGGRSVTELTLLAPQDPRTKSLVGLAKQNGMLSGNVTDATAALSNLPPAPSSPVHYYYVRVPASKAHDIIQSINKEANNYAATEVANPDDSMIIHPANIVPIGSTENFQIPQNTATRLKTIFDHSPATGYDKRPVLIIVDDAFPSQQAWEDSKSFFTDALNEIYSVATDANKGWEAPFGDFPEAQNEPTKIEAPRKLKGCEAGLDAGTCRFHAKSIELALRTFTAIETSDKEPVRVVWLPLLNTQDGTLAQMAKVFRVAETVLGMTQLGYGDFRAYSDIGYKDLEQDFRNLSGKLVTEYPDSINDWRTPTPLLYAVVDFAQWYSHISGVPVFINFSWTFSAELDGARPESGFYKTALIVAAGNPCQTGVNCSGYTEDLKGVGDYDFLRSFESYPNRYIFVANVDSTGQATCASAHPRPQSGVFAFPGNVSGDCGSSFSAPRVAWLLAAREAYRNLDATYKDQVGKWFPFVYKEWFSTRNISACKNPIDLSCAVLNIDSLFDGVNPL